MPSVVVMTNGLSVVPARTINCGLFAFPVGSLLSSRNGGVSLIMAGPGRLRNSLGKRCHGTKNLRLAYYCNLEITPTPIVNFDNLLLSYFVFPSL